MDHRYKDGAECGGEFNHNCPYYPCHTGLSDHEFDCEYCYCPIYFLPNCGGNYKILKSGIKDCSDCTLNHTDEGKKIVEKTIKERYNEWLSLLKTHTPC